MTQTNAVKKAVAKYDKENIKGVYIKLHKEKDRDIIKKLESVESKQGYIKSLIRDDLIELSCNEVIEILDTISTIGEQVDALEFAIKAIKKLYKINDK